MAPTRTTVVVSNVSFLPDGSVIVTYMDAIQDERNRGLLVANHQIQIHPGDGGKDYEDEIEDVRDAVRRLLGDALDDFVNTPPASEEDEPDSSTTSDRDNED